MIDCIEITNIITKHYHFKAVNYSGLVQRQKSILQAYLNDCVFPDSLWGLIHHYFTRFGLSNKDVLKLKDIYKAISNNAFDYINGKYGRKFQHLDEGLIVKALSDLVGVETIIIDSERDDKKGSVFIDEKAFTDKIVILNHAGEYLRMVDYDCIQQAPVSVTITENHFGLQTSTDEKKIEIEKPKISEEDEDCEIINEGVYIPEVKNAPEESKCRAAFRYVASWLGK